MPPPTFYRRYGGLLYLMRKLDSTFKQLYACLLILLHSMNPLIIIRGIWNGPLNIFPFAG